jgi:hypothetical protein
VTVGDVAAASGLKLADVEDGLRALAADTQATLQVSNAGDVVYVFPSDPRAALLARSWLLRVEPAWNWLKVTTTPPPHTHTPASSLSTLLTPGCPASFAAAHTDVPGGHSGGATWFWCRAQQGTCFA